MSGTKRARTPSPAWMDTGPPVVTAESARLLLLSLQRLATPPVRSSARAVHRLVEALGYVQIDSINVIERAHHLILGTRLEGYRPLHLTSNLETHRTLFEHWTHDASAVPVRWYSHWKHRFARDAWTPSRSAWWRSRFGGEPALILQAVVDRVRSEGPLRARDFTTTQRGSGASGGWWEWSPQKAALELLWRSGVLLIAGRDGFEKLYDLAERVHPGEHAVQASGSDEHENWACREAIARLGVATASEISNFFRALPVATVRRWIAASLKSGEVEPVRLEDARGGKPTPGVALPGWQQRRRAVNRDRIVALCPFDPLIRERSRTERIFGFDYRFEAFTPAARRRFGYYVLPLLEGDRLVGRIDPKLDRQRGILDVRGPWWEQGIRPDRARLGRLEEALSRLAGMVGADSWSLTRPRKGRLSAAAR